MSSVPSASTKPFARFEWLLAARYLRSRRSGRALSVSAIFSFLGIMLGVATLITVMSVMNGMRTEILDKIVGINGHIFIGPIDKPLTDYAELTDRFSKIVGVKMVIPMVEGEAFASSPVGGSGVLVRGVRGQDIGKINSVANTLKEGTIEGFDAKNGVAIARRLATALGVHVGDTLTLTSPRGAATPFGIQPRQQTYPVVALFEIGMSEFDNRLVYLPLAESQAFFNRKGDVSFLEVFLDNPDRVDRMRLAIDSAADRPLTLSDWRQRNRQFFSVLEVERNVMFLILLLIVIVAAFNIISGQTMLVKDKTAAIAILRTIGATRFAVMRVFFINGASIGIVGTIAGFLLGLVLTWNVESIRQVLSLLTQRELFPAEFYFLSRLPAEINPWEVVTVVATALGLSFLAPLYPAWQAARLDPVDALRYG
jgi:lipoprotein-releasing system permease protein